MYIIFCSPEKRTFWTPKNGGVWFRWFSCSIGAKILRWSMLIASGVQEVSGVASNSSFRSVWCINRWRPQRKCPSLWCRRWKTRFSMKFGSRKKTGECMYTPVIQPLENSRRRIDVDGKGRWFSGRVSYSEATFVLCNGKCNFMIVLCKCLTSGPS